MECLFCEAASKKGIPPEIKNIMIKVLTLCLITSLLLLSSCGVSQDHWFRVESQLARGNFNEAASLIEKGKENEYGKKNALLFYLDKAIILHHQGQYVESNKLLEKAELLIEDLYTKSISTEAAALLTSDNMKPYEGEDFEKVLIHLFSCLNYIYLEEWENALVEGRKVDHKLQLISDRYESENKKRKAYDKPVKVAYTEDAFVRQIMGEIFESEKEINDAFLFYRKSLDTYKNYSELYGTRAPSFLPEDLLRISSGYGFKDEFLKFKETFPNIPFKNKGEISELGTLYFIFYNGFAPYKEEVALEVVHPLKKNVDAIRIALPKFVKRPPRIKNAEIVIKGNNNELRAYTELSEDISEIAARSLNDRYPKIIAKTIARFIAKEIAKIGAEKSVGGEAGRLIGIGASIAAFLTEKADLRSWRLLPAEIQTQRIFLAPGTYEVEIIFKNNYGGIIGRKLLSDVAIERGKIKFISERAN